ncbi:response regulator [Paenibacillus sacheonensis]|uniref:Response regulator n=1 Tax=Paenibacillus sacheonensis TaxID=742054 RepID=A0A7X4YN59_9BACL|nr:response regulator [Paenibacillus sacheonensis]MBM7566075.1 two-component system response regulator YesN [Paenibacillus sacheonensis]NBC68616.1 response regulator [Paenibacillus sacheonensis]
MYKVLLADDEPLALEGLKIMVNWEKWGFRIDRLCRNGEEAIEHIRLNPPDLVVTDIRMPVLNGLELIDETRRSGNRSTLFVIASGYDDFDYARQAMNLGVKHYLTKPIIESEADEVLERMQNELCETEKRMLMRTGADRYAVRRALSMLLFGGEEANRQELMRTLKHLSSQASNWTYVQVRMEEEMMGSAREVALRMAEENGRSYVIDRAGGSFGLILGSDQADNEGVDAFVERLHAAMRAAAFGRIEIAVGCDVDDLNDLPRSYRSAIEAARFLFFGGTPIVHYAKIQGQKLSFDPRELKAVDIIVETMENARPDDLASAIREVFRTFEERMVQPELVRIFETQVMLACASLFKQLGGDPDEMRMLWDSISDVEHGKHLQKSTDTLIAFCLKCQAAVRELQEMNCGGTPAKVADFLRRHYKETFTIKEIAERFYINPVYLGQSFSRKYGIGILDFIHDIRIEKAQQRLRETNEASCAIAEALGYRGYQHFLKQFEKRIGMKPSDYRLHHFSK